MDEGGGGQDERGGCREALGRSLTSPSGGDRLKEKQGFAHGRLRGGQNKGRSKVDQMSNDQGQDVLQQGCCNV